MRRWYTVMIVPHAGAQFRKICLSSRLLTVFAILGVSSLLTAAFLLTHYLFFHKDLQELRQLRASNAELSRRNLDYEVSTEHLNRKVAALQDFVKKLSVMAGLDASQGTGVGGPRDVDFTTTNSAYAQVKEELDHMESELLDLEQKSRVLERFYDENTLMLASTPSIWPVRGYLSSSFGYRKDPFTGQREMHYGLDISTQSGRPVVATADGIVLYASRRGTYGNVAVVDHKFGLMTRYAHLSGFNTRAGRRVKRGDVIGYVGSTGRSRAPHLHYEVWVDNRTVHPLNYVLEYYRSFDARNRPMPKSSATAP